MANQGSEVAPPSPEAILAKCEAMLKQGQDLIAASKKEATPEACKSKREDGTSLLSEACEAMGSAFGPNDIQCVKFHLQFGQALVRNVQSTSEVLSSEPEGEQEESDEKSEPTDDLLVAWEVLELARVQLEQECAKSDSKENALMLAQVYGILGELQLENEEFERAYEDFAKSLQIQQKYKSLGDRDLAVRHSDLAMSSLCLEDKQRGYALALQHYRYAARVFQFHVLEETAKLNRLTNLSCDPSQTAVSDLQPAVKSVFDGIEQFEQSFGAIKEAKVLLEELEEKIAELEHPELEVSSFNSQSATNSSSSSPSELASTLSPLESIMRLAAAHSNRQGLSEGVSKAEGSKEEPASGTNFLSFETGSCRDQQPATIVNVKRKAKSVDSDTKKPKTVCTE